MGMLFLSPRTVGVGPSVDQCPVVPSLRIAHLRCPALGRPAPPRLTNHRRDLAAYQPELNPDKGMWESYH